MPSLHRESLLPFLADHCAVDTFGPHSRMGVPFKGIEAMADVPEERVARSTRHDHGHLHLPVDGDGRPHGRAGRCTGSRRAPTRGVVVHLIEGCPGVMDEPEDGHAAKP